VRDDGCGMDKATVSQVFEPFFTTKERGRGTGLGLATVYGAVRQNDGFVTVDSEPGRGSTFAIHLPRHRGAAAAAPKRESAPAPAPCGRTILLVEDESDLIALLTEALTRSGFRVLAAQTPNEAIRLASAGGAAIDLVVTDLIMPQMNGRELVTRLDALVPGLRHLYMSGYTANIIGDHGLLGAGEPFLQKPFAFEALLAKVNALLSA
jgi:two-component system cell cycle sensor histidine kinase/response regulator CckA